MEDFHAAYCGSQRVSQPNTENSPPRSKACKHFPRRPLQHKTWRFWSLQNIKRELIVLQNPCRNALLYVPRAG